MNEENPNNEPKTCLECGELLGAGRSDRKFCNDVCRTAYNNRRRSQDNEEITPVTTPDPLQTEADRDMTAISKIQDILLSNRVKLYNMYHLYERMLSLDDFNRYGINLRYFTGLYADDSYFDYTFRMCFDYGYHIEGRHVYLVYAGSEIYFN